MIWSRFISVRKDGRYLKSMVPFIDMFNHHLDASVEHYYDAKDKCFKVTTLQSWEKGDQVYMNYGPVPNRRVRPCV